MHVRNNVKYNSMTYVSVLIGAQAIQLHGGIGMTNEYIVGHCFKRLMVIEQLLVSAQRHLRALAPPHPVAA